MWFEWFFFSRLSLGSSAGLGSDKPEFPQTGKRWCHQSVSNQIAALKFSLQPIYFLKLASEGHTISHSSAARIFSRHEPLALSPLFGLVRHHTLSLRITLSRHALRYPLKERERERVVRDDARNFFKGTSWNLTNPFFLFWWQCWWTMAGTSTGDCYVAFFSRCGWSCVKSVALPAVWQ